MKQAPGLNIAAPIALAAALAGCTTGGGKAPEASPQDAFWARLQALCGKAYEGRVVSSDPADAGMAGERLTMHVADCSDARIRIPFHVGENRSRTWIVTRTADGLRLKHDHRHEDGSPDAVTMYGGDTAGPGGAGRQEFPVDAESIAMFQREGRPASVTNVWAIEIGEGRYVYELRRPPGPDARHFRVEFDLTREVTPPELPWGWQAG